MATKVSLCNRALVSLGIKQRITSMTEDTEVARKCNLILDDIIDEVLRSYNWNCATDRAALAQLSTAPAWGYTYQYALPVSPYCLRVIQMEDPEDEFKIEGRNLLTDEATCNILYIKRITDINEMDSLLKAAIAARLAAELAFSLTNSNSQQEAMWNIYVAKLTDASEIDAQEGTAGTWDSSSWIDERA